MDWEFDWSHSAVESNTKTHEVGLVGILMHLWYLVRVTGTVWGQYTQNEPIAADSVFCATGSEKTNRFQIQSCHVDEVSIGTGDLACIHVQFTTGNHDTPLRAILAIGHDSTDGKKDKLQQVYKHGGRHVKASAHNDTLCTTEVLHHAKQGLQPRFLPPFIQQAILFCRVFSMQAAIVLQRFGEGVQRKVSNGVVRVSTYMVSYCIVGLAHFSVLTILIELIKLKVARIATVQHEVNLIRVVTSKINVIVNVIVFDWVVL